MQQSNKKRQGETDSEHQQPTKKKESPTLLQLYSSFEPSVEGAEPIKETLQAPIPKRNSGTLSSTLSLS